MISSHLSAVSERREMPFPSLSREAAAQGMAHSSPHPLALQKSKEDPMARARKHGLMTPGVKRKRIIRYQEKGVGRGQKKSKMLQWTDPKKAESRYRFAQ